MYRKLSNRALWDQMTDNEKFVQVQEMYDTIDELIADRNSLLAEAKEYRAAAESWMKSYDELEAKYNPLVLTHEEVNENPIS